MDHGSRSSFKNVARIENLNIIYILLLRSTKFTLLEVFTILLVHIWAMLACRLMAMWENCKAGISAKAYSIVHDHIWAMLAC